MERDYEEAAAYLLTVLKQKKRGNPVIGVICGSGLSGLAKCIDPSSSVTVNYENIPGFPQATVAGHMGEMVFGTIGGMEVACLRGRFHFYEGNSMSTVGLPVRVMRLLGVKLLVVTNAAGGLNPSYNVGDIAIIQDHFGLPLIAGNHPLRGSNDDALGPRFPAVSDAYDEVLQTLIMKCAAKLDLTKFLRPDATYCFVSGPAYESRAECRFLRNSIGGDTVGMSTIPEIITAKHAGMKILCLSLVTNKVVFEKQKDTVHASHKEVLDAVETSGKRVEALVTALITKENLGDYLEQQPSFKWQPKRSLSTTIRRAANKLHQTVQQSTLLQIGLLAAAAGAGWLLAQRKR